MAEDNKLPDVAEENVIHEHVDFQPEEYESRSTDKEGNPDDKLTEKEAVAQAKKEGIEFVDEFTIEGDEENTIYPTRAKAEAKAGDRNIIQTRRQK